MPRYVLLLLAALLTACSREPPPPPPDFTAADALAQQMVARRDLPAVAYAVVSGGRIVHQAGLNATPSTPFPLASLTKPITATALMAMVEQGAIELDEPALKYLGQEPTGVAAYTVAQLAGHTAGLPTYARIWWKGQQPRPLLQNLPAYGFNAQPPGTVFEYSNLGYGLLGEIIAARSQMPLRKVLEDRVFKPLGMHSSSLAEGFDVPKGAAPKSSAKGKVLPATANDSPGAGNAYSSARDLALFAAFHLGLDTAGSNDVLSAKARERMQVASDLRAQHPYYGGAGYGIGWYVSDTGPERVVWHEGGMPGASSILMMLPRRGVAAVVLSNATDVNARTQEIANALLRAVAPDYEPMSFLATNGFDEFRDQRGLAGRWAGEIVIDGKPMPWSLEFQDGGAVWASFPTRAGKLGPTQSAYAALVSGPLLVATFPGRLPGKDVNPRGGMVLLRMMAREDELTGQAVAYSSEQRLEHLYPFKANLKKR